MASPIQLKNNAVGRLTSGVSSLATTLVLVSGDGAKFPTLTGAQYFPATLIRASDSAVEIVKVTARSGDVLTVVRAQEGTSGLVLLAGDRVEIRFTAGTFTDEVARIEAIAQDAEDAASDAAAAAAAAQSTANSALSLASAAAPDTSVVKLTGAQTIAGVKTFSDKPVIPDATAAQNPVSKAQLDAETAARTAAIAAAVLPSTLAPTLFVGSASVSLSGSNVDFTAIPSWVKRVTITLSGASTNGTVVPFIQLGTGAGPTWDTTSTYKGSGFGGSTGASPGVNLNTSGFNLRFSSGAAEVWHATIILTRHDSASNTWSLLSVGSNETAVWTAAGGTKALSAPLTSIRLSCGANSFDAGTASIAWE